VSRPYVLLSVAVSIDGYTDDTSPKRLLLSNEEDFDRVDQVRSEMDAILIGAGTVRTDNPRLIVKSAERRAARIRRGESEHPLKVTISASGKLDSSLEFWHIGGEKIVYTTDVGAERLRAELTGLADVVSLGTEVDFGMLLDDLARRGVKKLMVEGGGSIHTAFLSAGLVDEIHLAVAPVVVGDSGAPRFLNPGSYLGGPRRRMQLVEAKPIGDVVLLRYHPKIASAS